MRKNIWAEALRGRGGFNKKDPHAIIRRRAGISGEYGLGYYRVPSTKIGERVIIFTLDQDLEARLAA